MVYFDYAATSPIDKEVLEIYNEAAVHAFGNSQSLHDTGSFAAEVLLSCRKNLARLLGVPSEGLYFTSGGTESNLLSIVSLAKSQVQKGKHLIISMGEHPSVYSAVNYLKDLDFRVTEIPFTQNGIIDLDALQKAIQPDTVLACIQHVNSEIGTIQPLRLISKILQPHGILLHSDCVQSFGKLLIQEIIPYIHSLSISSHKIYGPKGAGAVYIHPKIPIVPLFPGFHHEKGFRGGTVNVPGISAFVFAAEKLLKGVSVQQEYYKQLRNALIEELQLDDSAAHVYQAMDDSAQLPQIIGLCLNGIEGQHTMLECSRRGFAISTGSACQIGQQKAAGAMAAMGIEKNKAKEFIRISFGKSTELQEVKELVSCLKKVQKEFKAPIKI